MTTADDATPADANGSNRPGRQEQSTGQTVSQILEETRIVLPGTQTLFGF